MLAAMNVILVLLLVGTSITVVLLRDLLAATVVLSGYGLLMAILWTRLGAPDLALIYAALVICVTSVLLVVSINRTERKE